MRAVAIRFGLSLLSAVLLFLSVPTFGLWPLMWIALVPQLVVALDASTHKRAFLYGWFTGTVAGKSGSVEFAATRTSSVSRNRTVAARRSCGRAWLMRIPSASIARSA